MSSWLRGSSASVIMSWWWEPSGQGRRIEFPTAIAARAYLARLGVDPDGMLRLRRLLAMRGAAPVGRMDNGEVVDQLAHWVAAGQLRLSAVPRAPLPSLLEEAVEDAPVPLVTRPARPREVAPELAPRPVEEATFSSDVDAEAIAAAMREAAQLGVPFCEECFKAKRKMVAPVEPDTFPEDADTAAIAAAMTRAAATGIPFCEECMKHQKRQAKLNGQRADH